MPTRDLSDFELEEAVASTSSLASLGMRGGAPLTHRNPYTPIGAPSPPSAASPPSGVDMLLLDGSRLATVGGRTFELTLPEMTKVIANIEKAYARAMKRELSRVREAISGETLRKMQEAAGTANTQDLRRMPGPGITEIAYSDTPPEVALPELRPPVAGPAEVPGVPSTEPGSAGPAAPDPRPRVPRRTATAGLLTINPVLRDWLESPSIEEGGGTAGGGSH